jgi:hypothetical protein
VFFVCSEIIWSLKLGVSWEASSAILVTTSPTVPPNDLPGEANGADLEVSHSIHAGFSFARVWVSHNEFPGAVGLPVENLDRLSRRIDRRALKVDV